MTLISPALRQLVFDRAGARCEYCQLSQHLQVATFPVDHIVPRARGGKTVANNLALTCPRCNAFKWATIEGVDELTGAIVPLFHPRTDQWEEHFRWAPADATLLEGLTPIGRVTITILDLNAAPHLDIRRHLLLLGRHPSN